MVKSVRCLNFGSAVRVLQNYTLYLSCSGINNDYNHYTRFLEKATTLLFQRWPPVLHELTDRETSS